jgi:hypothetical protein
LILRIGPATVLKHPGRCLRATGRLLGQRGFWRLTGWTVGQALLDLVRLPLRLVPTGLLPRYAVLPRDLRPFARFAETRLRHARWTYLGVNLWFQLELTRAQIPLQRLGKVIEHLVTMLALCHHATQQDGSQQRVAALQCEQLRVRVKGLRLLTGLPQMERLRRLVAGVGDDIEKQQSTLLRGIEPQPFAHPFEAREKRSQKTT